MASRIEIEGMIRLKEFEIQSLEEKIVEARAYIRALKDCLDNFKEYLDHPELKPPK